MVLLVFPLLCLTITLLIWFKYGYERSIKHTPIDVLGRTEENLESELELNEEIVRVIEEISEPTNPDYSTYLIESHSFDRRHLEPPMSRIEGILDYAMCKFKVSLMLRRRMIVN